jgi:hypothetical protein
MYTSEILPSHVMLNIYLWEVSRKVQSAHDIKCRRVIPEDERKCTLMHTCQRCNQTSCPGNSNILNCKEPCTVPCKACKQLSGCRGVDGGRICTYETPNLE